MSRGALEAMLSVTGQQEFAATMDMAMGKVRELAATTDLVTKNMAAMNTRLDAAFNTQRVSQIRGVNSELNTMKGHLKGIVGMLGGGGMIGGFALFEGIKNAVQVQTNQMQWVSEAGVSPRNVGALSRYSGSLAGQGISQIDAGAIIRQVESAYNGTVSTTDPRMTGIMNNSNILSAITGGKFSPYEAASTIIPALQADKSLGNNAKTAARVILAMTSAGNMQVSDALSILQTPALGTAAGAGITLQDLAPFYAYGADQRGGPQAQQFARTLATSFINLQKGGASKPGRLDLASILGDGSDTNKSIGDINHILQSPDGAVKAVSLIYQKLSHMKGGLDSNGDLSGQSLNAIFGIFGGTRGGQGPLAVFSNPKLWQQKQDAVNKYLDPAYYDQATGLALNNEQHKIAVAKAEFSNTLTNLGNAAIPILNQVLPPLTELFKMMGNPNVLKFVEAMLLLRGASMLSAGVAGAGGVSGLLPLLNKKMNPYAAFRNGRKLKTAATLAEDAVRLGEGGLAADAGASVLGGLALPAALGAGVLGIAASDTNYANSDILRQLTKSGAGLADAGWMNQSSAYKSQVPSGMGHTFITFQDGAIRASDPQKAAEEMAKELAKAAARK